MASFPNPVEQLLRNADAAPDDAYLHQPVADAWRTYSWGQVADQARRMASALIGLGLAKGSRVAITGVNTAHWFMADFACGLAGLVSVGLYPRQTSTAVRHIMEHSEAKALFLGPMPDVDGFLKALPTNPVTIALPYPNTARHRCEHHWDVLVAAHEPLNVPVSRDDNELWTLIYTSGTTGSPKGVMITAANIKFASQGVLAHLPPRVEGEHLLSYLPLAHAFERDAVEIASLYLRCEVSFLESMERLPATLRRVRPTRFYGVPLVWTRLQAAVLREVPEEKLNWLLAVPIISRIVRRKLAVRLGLDRCWLRVSGAASLSTQTLCWFKKIGLEIYQGYGMTENSIYCSTNLPGANRLGSVGQPFRDSPVRISRENEIQNRHPGVTPGYYKDPEGTARLFTADGWLRTGDIGRLDEDGYLYVTGRLKDIFKTTKGKYVTPTPIEKAFARNTDVEHLCFVGHDLPQPVMLVVLNTQARQKPRSHLEAGLRLTMVEINAGLEAHERVAKIVVVRDDWTIENGLLTPTMKVRRSEIEKRYGDRLREEFARRSDVTWED